MNRRFTFVIAAAMAGGVLAGAVLNACFEPGQIERITEVFAVASDIFLRLIKMVIAPLVLSTLVAGIARMDGAGQIGRTGARALVWFLGASLCSLLLGAILVNVLEPGAGLALQASSHAAAAPAAGELPSWRSFLVNVVPRSAFEALSNNEILQIVVFAVFIGAAMATSADKMPALLALAEQTVSVMLKVTGYVMLLAPVAIFAAIASTVAENGLGVVATYGRFVAGFYAGLGLLLMVLLAAGFVLLGPRIGELMRALYSPLLLAFSTASSEAAYPPTLEQLQCFGVSRRVSGFVLPLGYSFNLDGSMMYCTFAVIFIAQAYGIELSMTQQATMLLILLVTSKGMAGVPRGSLVVVAATLPYFGLPQEGLLLVLAIDHVLDMGRSATNVIGNSIAAVAVAKWEGEPLSVR